MEHYYGNKHELKKLVLDHFKEIGVVAPACRKAGVSRTTLYRWLSEDEAFDAMMIEAMAEAYQKHKEELDAMPDHKKSSFLHMVVY